MYIIPDSQRTFDGELSHHGILGMKWGIRRFQPYPKGEKKGKEIGDAARKVTNAGRKAVMAVGKAAMPVANVGIKAGKAINKKRKERLKQFNEDVSFYKKYGRASKEKNKDASDIKKAWMAEGDYYADKYLYGKKGVKRIRDKVEKQGITLKQAQRSESLRYYARAVGATAATMGTLYLLTKGGDIKQGFANAAQMIKNNKNFVNTTGYTLNSDLLLPFKK